MSVKVSAQAVSETIKLLGLMGLAPTYVSAVESYVVAKRLAAMQLKPSIATVNKVVEEVFVLFPQNLEKGRFSFGASDRDGEAAPKWRTVSDSGRGTVWNVCTRGDTKARDLFNDRDIRNGLRSDAAEVLGTSLSGGQAVKPSRQALAVFLVRDALFDVDPDEASVMAKLGQLFGITKAELDDFTVDEPLSSPVAGQPQWDPQLLPDVLKPDTAETAEPVIQHFILNKGSAESQEEYGDVLGEKLGFDSDVHGRNLLLSVRRGRFIYYRTSGGKPKPPDPSCFIGMGDITDVIDVEPGDDGKQRWTALLANYEPFSHPVPRASYTPPGWNYQHGISEISKEDYDKIVELGTGGPTSEPFTASALATAAEDARLVVDAPVTAAIVAALNSRKHVILTGPPGTAKTTLAEVTARLAKSSGLCSGYKLTTATSDWTTYETIGGLSPSKEGLGLEFRKGHFLQAAANNEWLVIDELNRSNFDRAFGQLFTILSGQSVVLPYEDPDSSKPIAIVLEGDDLSAYDASDYSILLVPGNWRILATMNVFDKSLLFEMSFALMRRFAFIEVPSPADAVFRRLWTDVLPRDLEPSVADSIDAVLSSLLALRAIKEIGPAVFLDMARFAAHFTGPTTSVDELAYQLFYSYLLPQFEGVDRKEGLKLFSTMSDILSSALRPKLRATLSAVLGISIDGLTPAKNSVTEEFDTET
jgi:MoxR-like ATPase